MTDARKESHYGFKITILGGGAVGKTCLFNRYCFNSFSFNTLMTIGINFHSTKLQVICGKENKKEFTVINSIFDFGGQERFKPLIPKFLDGTSGALLVFDISSFASFQALDYWYSKLIENLDSRVPTLLISSKYDLVDKVPNGQLINDKLIQKFVEEKKLDGYFPTSALENINVLKVFKELTKLMLKKNHKMTNIKIL
ncbi:MAG: Rab family GTPase [Promethearchaeia archaeon]